MADLTILKLSCPDRVGLLARLTGFVAGRGGNLIEVHQFTDAETGWFFARLAIDSATLAGGPSGLERDFAASAAELGAEWTVRDAAARSRLVIAVSKLDHCLLDLLWRCRSGELHAEVPLVIGNHETLRAAAEREGVEFRHLPFTGADKEASFRRMSEWCAEAGGDVLVLARFMQILPGWFCREMAGHIINIHHSFLPAFVGANPYRRAYDRGVKLIGATCHYATESLDDGPIIDQEVVRVEHFHSFDDLLRLGRDCERLALARGVRYHLNDRVLIHGKKSIVFRD